MPFHFALISSFLLASAVLANSNGPGASGGVEITDGDNGTFHSVTASFTAPYLTAQSSCAAAVLILLDGRDCLTSVELGIDFYASPPPAQSSYLAWFRTLSGYQPIKAEYFPIKAGDNISLTVKPSDDSPFNATLHLENPRKTLTLDVGTGEELCGKRVGWFMASVPWFHDGEFYDFCDFGTVVLDAAAYGLENRTHYTPMDATDITDVMYTINDTNHIVATTRRTKLEEIEFKSTSREGRGT